VESEKVKKICAAVFVCCLFTAVGLAQTKIMPKVTQIDEVALENIIKPNGKPLLINFWATWCDPCREEFPELVQIDAKYKGKIDFITVSLDDIEDINTGVPQFLVNMKAEMPTYLLKTRDEGTAIAMVAPDWQGGLPFTVLFDRNGKITHFRQGKIKIETLCEKIDELLKIASLPN
jgi:thiol-disulfide isomerase/thioredoxin